MANALYYDMMAKDPERTKFEPFTAEECKTAAIARTDKIRAHNKKIFSELEEFAIYFYSEADYESIAKKCNARIEDAWQWG